MEELIKEAERLRVKLLEVVLHIPYDFDPDDTIALSQTTDILKQLYGRKDNIVDLGEIWHNVREEPDRTQDILIDSYSVGYYVPTTILFSEEKWSHCISNYAIKRWAYIKDLLPKGNVE